MTEAKASKAEETSKPPEQKKEVQKTEDTSKPKSEKTESGGGSSNPLTIFNHWCKACNICIAFCPQKVFIPDRDGKPIVKYPEKCTQCAFCWMHCPDLAIVSNEK